MWSMDKNVMRVYAISPPTPLAALAAKIMFSAIFTPLGVLQSFFRHPCFAAYQLYCWQATYHCRPSEIGPTIRASPFMINF